MDIIRNPIGAAISIIVFLGILYWVAPVTMTTLMTNAVTFISSLGGKGDALIGR